MSRAAAALAGIGAVIATGAGACHPGDKEIRDAFTAAFDAPPVLAVAPCADGDEKLARLRPLFELAMRSSKAARTLDQPLPADLQADLMALPMEGLASDYHCFLADGRGHEVLMGEIANLYLHKAETLLAQGKAEDGWDHVLQGLKVYSGPRPIAFIVYFSAGSVARHIRALVARNRPEFRDLDRLELMAASALLRRPDYCAGLNLEFLSQAYQRFHEALAPLRGRVRERWGDDEADMFERMTTNDQRGDVALWRATADLYEPLVAGCRDPKAPPLAPLERAARAKLTATPSIGSITSVVLNRLHQYGDLEDEFLLFHIDLGRRRLQLAGVRYDAASVRQRLLVPSLPVPLVSSWDGSLVVVEDDPTTPGALIVTRGRRRQVLPPLPPLPPPPR